MFKCSFCGKEFENALDRANCEIECDKEIKVKAERQKQEKLRKQQQERKDEVTKAYNEYIETCNKAKEKYLAIRSKYDNDYNNGYYFDTWDLNTDCFGRVIADIVSKL